MNIKCESEIKIEELDLEYDSYKQDSQIFCDNESDVTLKAEDIKIEKLDENVSIKSELTESEKEFVLDEGLVNNGVIKSENMMLIEEKSCGQHSKTLLSDVNEVEKGWKRKSSSRRRMKPQTLVIEDESIQKDHLENRICKFCNFSFKSEDELQSHLKTHDKKFKCNFCSFESNLKTNLNHHLVIHSNTKLFRCSKCSYESNYKHRLKVHLLNHENKKLFKCSECNYEFNRKDVLKKHMLIHGNV
ncbi:UNVERIFIED_CONTAM: hypothetical protein RMT77_015331 [Armadillidium vulgare]